MAQVSVSIATAVSLLNDSIQSIWTNTILLPFFNEAYRELQTKLKLAGCPVQMLDNTYGYSIGVTTFTIANIIEPIILWEKASGQPDTTYQRMTEVSKLPFVAPGPLLNTWRWDGQGNILLVGSTINEIIKYRIWAFFPDVTVTTTNIPFVNAENYLGPRVAALAAASIKEDADSTEWTALANQNLEDIIKSNRGTLNVSRP